MFERSPSGQQNRAIFHEVDITCYVEGGGGGDAHSPDITFWKSVFSYVFPGRKIKYLPRGGKPVLESLATQIVREDIKATLVAMDSDYDDFRARKIIDPRVYYTYGYSWENDVYSVSNLKEVYKLICHCDEISEEVSEFLSVNLDKLFRELRLPVFADYIALCGGSSVFPRTSPGRVIGSDNDNGCPVVKTGEILKLCRGANEITKGKRGAANPMNDNVPRNCVGHVLAHGVIMILKACIIQFYKRNSRPAPDHIRDIAITTFRELLHSVGEPPVESVAYYRALRQP